MKLYGFLQDEKWIEDFGHILIGMVPGWGWWREHRQWPPGDPVELTLPRDDFPDSTWVTQLDRVADSYRDFFGYALGDAIRTGFLIGVIAGMWWVR